MHGRKHLPWIAALAACAGGGASPPPPAIPVLDASAPDVSIALAADSADASAVLPAPAAQLADALRPTPGDALLLLGLHVERIEGYSPMFSSEGVPRTDTRPGYVTVLIRTKNGTATVVGSLPYLAVPQQAGFLFIGESSVRIHLPDDPRVTMYDGSPMPRTYDATDLWKTADRNAISRVSGKLAARLKAARAWGTEKTTQLIYVTRNAWCTVHTESEVTGGALYFHASTTYDLDSLDGSELSDNLIAYVGETTFRRFVSELLSIKPEQVEFDRPYRDGFMTYSWLDDVQAVISHREGVPMLSGAIRRAGNSARTFMESAPVGPAPESLAPGSKALDFRSIVAAIPRTKDALVSPSNDVVLSLASVGSPDAGADRDDAPDHIVIWDVAARQSVGTLPLGGRPVMVEWGEGDQAAAWLAALGPLAARRN
jgi:hypothetical protein